MIFDDDVFYSLRPKEAAPKRDFVTTFYKRMTAPHSLLLIVAGAMLLSWKEVIPIVLEMYRANHEHVFVLIFLLLATFTVGSRVLQSFYWADQHYERLEYSFIDILSFFAVIVFISGYLFVWFVNFPGLILLGYTVLSIIGFINFFLLARKRIPRLSDKYDTPTERRIQIFNSLIFFLISVAFGISYYLLNWTAHSENWIYSALTIVIFLSIANIVHSHQLSIWPRLLIDNNYLSPEKIEERIDAIVGHDEIVFKDSDGFKEVFDIYERNHVQLFIRRATHEDLEYLTGLYLHNCGYVLEYLLNQTDKSIQRKFLTLLLKNASGLGPLGYLRFYIITSEGRPLGFIMPSFSDSVSIYSSYGTLSILTRLLFWLGPKQLWGICIRTKGLVSAQPEPESNELRINYIVIEQQERRKGIGVRVLRLIRQAFLQSSTANFQAERVTAFVRESNAPSVALFKTANFKEEISDDTASQSQIRIGSSDSRLIRMSLTEAP